MGSSFEAEDVVLLFDYYSAESQSLHTSFKLAGKKYPVLVIEEDGFLPEDANSVFGFFLGEYVQAEKVPGKPRYFNQIQLPPYWEITANNTSGKIYELNKERGRIFYALPAHKRLVKAVDWLDEKGVVRSTDHYNKYGVLYARTVYNAKGQKVTKSYFSAEGKERIVQNYVTGDIIVNDGPVVRIFKNVTELTCYVLEKAGFAGKRLFFNSLSTPFFVSQRMPGGRKEDVLFWQENVRPDIPGNMQMILSGKATRTEKIMVQKKAAYDKLIDLGASKDMLQPLGYIYPFKKENTHTSQVLICTNSDRIVKCREMAESLPNMRFHIVALTEMSSKLMSMEAYSNVRLYPAVKHRAADELFEKCDYYLDINHEGEILAAVQNAFLHNQLILGFKETLHNRNYLAEEHIFASEEVDKLIALLRALCEDKSLLEQHLILQHRAALAEKKDAYQGL